MRRIIFAAASSTTARSTIKNPKQNACRTAIPLRDGRFSTSLKHDNEKQFELFLRVDRARMPLGHDDRLAFVQSVRLAVDRDAADAVRADHERAPPEECVPISSSLSNENSVTLSASFCANVQLTTCPARYATRSFKTVTCFSRCFPNRPSFPAPFQISSSGANAAAHEIAFLAVRPR